VNFYGTDYVTNPAEKAAGVRDMDSDRVFASWELRSPRVAALAAGSEHSLASEPDRVIEIPADFSALLKSIPRPASANSYASVKSFESFGRRFGLPRVCAGCRETALLVLPRRKLATDTQRRKMALATDKHSFFG